MAEDSSGRRDRKLRLIAPVSIAAVLVAVVLAAVVLHGRQVPPAPPSAPLPPVPAQQPAAQPSVVGRIELLKAANALSAAYAEGLDLGPAKDPLVGRRFAIRIPFGCEGPQLGPGTAQAFYEFDPDRRTLRLVARPAAWTTLPVLASLPPKAVEDAEGFWIPRPWSYAEACPPRREQPVPAAPTAPGPPTLGLAQLFAPGGSRVTRHAERPYEHVLKLPEGEDPPLAQGYRLAIEGRIAAFPDGKAGRCWSESPDHRPVCLYAVEVERVAFERANGALIAEWRD